MVDFRSTHSAYYMSDCSGLRWSEQIKALQKLWCLLLICKAIWLPLHQCWQDPSLVLLAGGSIRVC